MHLRSCWSPHRRCSPLLDDGSLALNSLALSPHLTYRVIMGSRMNSLESSKLVEL